MSNIPSFEMIEIAPGRRLHYICEGPLTGPFVLCDAGAFGLYADCWWLKEELKKTCRVCLYDRAGMGASDPVPVGVIPSPDWHGADMRRLVQALGVTEPFILVGHSMAGLRLHAFANLWRKDLKGMVLVDALSPRQLQETSGQFLGKQFGWLLSAGAFAAEIGLAKPASVLTPNHFGLSGKMRADKVWSYGAASHFRASRNEVLAVDYQADYLHGNGVENLPLAIFTATLINGMKEQTAIAAKKNTGYGYFENRPKDSHVAILKAQGAAHIANCVQAIHAL